MSKSIPVRRVEFDFSAVPRDWCAGDPGMTHVLNAMCLLFPEGERMFVRSVRAFEDRIDDPALRDRIKGFYGQEANHGRAHGLNVAMLEAQGYEVAGWLAWYQRAAYGRTERLTPDVLRLSTTVALEHLTATLAVIAFDPDDVVEGAHPEMRALLRWHAAEEIEHKSVAFDVLRAVDGRRRVRALGLAMGVGSFVFFEMSAVRHLAAQDGRARGSRRQVIRELVRRPAILRSLAAYLRADFHPDQIEDAHLARAHLAAIGRLAG